jgi:lipid A disaccharide synthetase
LRRLPAALEGVSLQVLFPFEAVHYEHWAARLCQGHFFDPPAQEPARGDRLLLCPGSRRAVLRRNLPRWLDRLHGAGHSMDSIDVLVPDFLAEDALALCGRAAGPQVLIGKEEAFARAGAAIAFPGTMTMELFLQRIPTRVWAVLDPLTLWAGRYAMKGPQVALANMMAKEEVLPEWIGSASDFRRAPPPFPGQGAGENPSPPVPDAIIHAAWTRMGSNLGVEEGVKACRELSGFSASISDPVDGSG